MSRISVVESRDRGHGCVEGWWEVEGRLDLVGVGGA